MTDGSSVNTGSAEACKQTGWRRQFSQPSGIVGSLVGRLMAVKNAAMNDLVVELLEVQPDDRILEIGFAHGRTIQRLASRATRGLVAGVDISDTMLEQAKRRNRDFIEAGRVELHRSGVSRLPFPDRHFTKVCSANCFQFWPSPVDDLGEVKRVLGDGGLLLLCLRMEGPRKFLSAPGFTRAELDNVQDLVRRAGFRDVRTVERKLDRDVTCVLANR